MIQKKEILIEKEEQIQSEISDNKIDLYNVLSNCIDSNTNDFFSLDEEDYSLTELCEEATRIQSLRNINVTFPSEPTEILSNSLLGRELNIKNKIQYCNNLLRYALKKNGIDPQNCNSMSELINLLNDIDSVIFFDKYISNVSLDEESKNLDVSFIEVDDILSSNVLGDLYTGNCELYTDSSSYNNNYNNLFTDLDINEDGNLVYRKVRDELYDLGYLDEYFDILTSVIWKTGSNKPNVTVHLYVSGQEIDNTILTSNNPGHSFKNLPKYYRENEIQYTISVDAPSNFSFRLEKINNQYDIIEI